MLFKIPLATITVVIKIKWTAFFVFIFVITKSKLVRVSKGPFHLAAYKLQLDMSTGNRATIKFRPDI